MPTFLVTAKMNPALAARVQTSVTGRRDQRDRHVPRSGATTARRFIAVARVVFVVVLAVAVYTGVTTYRRIRRDLDTKRSELEAQITRAQADVTAKDRGAVDRASTWVTRLAGPYEGDVAPAGTLEAMLTRPALWVRGPIDSLRTREQLATTAAVSSKDALLHCLVDPPQTRTESAVLEKVRFVHAGGLPLEDATSNVRRLNDAIVGLPFLAPELLQRVRAAEDVSELAKLKKDFERVPIDRAKRALRSEILIVAHDEKGDGTGPTELDGERPHDVRLAIVDLDADRVLFRTRRHVDPSWISVAKRPAYASGLDGCALAYDLRHGK